MIKRLTVITDSRESLEWNLSILKKAATHGVDRIIIRGFNHVKIINNLLGQCRKYRRDDFTKIGVNAYPSDDISSLKPDFIHLNGHNARKFVEREIKIDIPLGLSIHNIQELKKFGIIEPEYILLSPVFKPSCKEGVETLGIEGLNKSCNDIKMLFKGSKIAPPRIIALGGINTHNYIDVLRCRDLHGIAVMSRAGELLL